jgi:hypothetical protein
MFGCGTIPWFFFSVAFDYHESLYHFLTGLEHIQLLLSKNQEVMNSSITHYKLILRGIFDATPIVPQTSTLDGRPVTSLTSNYLCLQCPSTVTEEERLRHGTKKQHRFCWLPRAAS